ncbi:MAG TPA: carbon-nitrogen hydrolase family protein [Longimicrobium sp.]|nr:carbon-nitrogen hydrolase family protein [Longimicrobium sp.]
MIVGLASPRVAASLEDGLERIERLLSQASGQGARIVCFPEAYQPGLHGVDIDVLPFDLAAQERVLQALSRLSETYGVATIMGMERITDAGRENAAVVIDPEGRVLGWQTKNQLDPSEDPFYVPGDTRRIFEVDGVRFGVVICHEGWRYPETVRWAAARGASIVFHPQHTGSNREGPRLTEWGSTAAPYYERAMMMRSIENTIYFASVNYALRFPDAATSLIDPSGQCQAYLPYGEEGVLVQSIDTTKATGLLAARYAPDRYRESAGEAGASSAGGV